jgi:dihydropteroate synthase
MFKIPARDRIWEINSPQVMGILNATSDSFFADSRVLEIDLALERVSQMVQEGVDIIDIGGQSTRPGAPLLSEQEELNNVLPIIESIHVHYPGILLSVDTFHSKVALESLKAGVHIVNDISGGHFDANMYKIVADQNAGYIGMHMTGNAQNMHQIPADRTSIIPELISYFRQKQKELTNMGIKDWIIDPGFGFGKSIQDNFTLVKELAALQILNAPILLGVSRKSSIYKTLSIDASEALNGTTVVNTIGLLNGASILRVHDVKEAQQIIQLLPYLSN